MFVCVWSSTTSASALSIELTPNTNIDRNYDNAYSARAGITALNVVVLIFM